MKKSREQEEQLSALAHTIDTVCKEVIYGEKMGFILVVFRFGDEGKADFISNAQRPGSIEALRELADRLESGEYIPPAIGSA